MRRLFLLLIMICVFISPLLAQDDNKTVTEPRNLTVSVFVDSAIIRLLPTQDSDFIASAFEGDRLYAVGRNADGSWFQIMRPYNDQPIGWISKKLVAYSFDMGLLPITDTETGVIGPSPVFDSGVSATILTEASIRVKPDFRSERVAIVPVLLTIPIVERSPDNQWLLVNYNGQVGWMAEFLARIVGDVESVPVSSQFPGMVVDLPIIPLEVQLAQVNRLRTYIQPNYELASSLSNFWAQVSAGEIVPCNPPPTSNLPAYTWTQQDVYELPELRRHVRRLDIAINDLNASIEAMQPCGVFTADMISAAYADAVNAAIIYSVVLDNLDYLEEEVIH
jgi:hypothetical protein